MKIYSWNVLCYNRNVEKVCAFIADLDFDVLCLQEVPSPLLERLKAMPYQIAYHVDVIRFVSSQRVERDYVVILSRHPLRGTGTLQFPDITLRPHAHVFVQLMSLFRWWAFVADRGALYADIEIHGRILRVFSVHLTLSAPRNRVQEFTLLMHHVDRTLPTIIGGDLNVFEYPPLKLLNWLVGSSLHEAAPWYPERELIEERFRKNGFQNPLRSHVTHGFSRSQLDHVLVTNDLHVIDQWVHPKTYGSDHYPVGVELELLTKKRL